MGATAIARARLPAERRFYSGMAVAILVTVFVGFARSFFLRPLFPDHPAPPEPIFYVHGAVFSAWIALLMVQTRLVASGRTDLHRAFGTFGAALAVTMVALGTLAALIAARRPGGFVGVPVPPLQFLAVPIAGIALFATFVSFAVAQRRNPQAHKRLMLLATLTLVTPALARWPVLGSFGPPAFFGVTDLFLIPLIAWDLRSRGGLHSATLWGGLALIASQPLQLAVSGTAAWLAFARWATGLLG
ncbi:MAG: hypothetical protein IRZ06_11100 [Nevskia sp.]|nr:hypothetical protein [Nevskia sp.]